MRAATFAIGIAFACAPWSQVYALSPAEVFAKASPSIVVVNALDAKNVIVGQGSGVVVGPGLVVTNCHVLKSADATQIRYRERIYAGTVRDVDLDRDLCSLDVRGLAAPVVTLGTSRMRVGDRVYTVGAPQGLELTLGDGLVSSLRGEGEFKLIQVTAPISPGSSGGGLFDEAGRLIGVTTLFLKDSQALNFAVPVEWISELPARYAAALEAADQQTRGASTGDEAAAETAERAADAAARAADAAAAARAAMAADEEIHWEEEPVAEPRTRWVVFFNDSKFKREGDSESVTHSGNRIKAWFRDTYHRPTSIGGSPNVTRTLSMIEYDCSTRSFRITEYNFYDAAGNVLWQHSDPYGSFGPIVPESYAESTYEPMCIALQKRKARG